MPRGSLAPLGILLLGALAGCHRAPTLHPAPLQESVRGASSVQFVADPANPARILPPEKRLHPPSPRSELAPPEYPARALAALAGPATVGLRLIVGVDGRVTRISDSPIVSSSAGPFAGEFRAAAEAAVERWIFAPAWIATLKDGPDRDEDGKADYRVAESTESIPVYLDVRIDFEIVEGRGTARVAGF